MSEFMKAVVVREPMKFALEQVELPRCPNAGLLLQVHACGLCGSDLRTLKSGHRRVAFPAIIGHEVSGRVVETGAGYTGPWQSGDWLAVAPVVYCGRCGFCVEGRFELCENIREIAQDWPGGFAEYLAVPQEAICLGTIMRVPQGLDPVAAAVSEPAASCVNAQEKLGVGLGDTVVIIGSGPIGCIHISIARAKGAGTVIVADVFDDRLALCEDFMPDHAVNAAKTDLVHEVMRLTGGRGADVVITANPVPETQVQAVEMARKGGRIAFFGGLPRENSKPGIDTNIIHYRGLHIIGTTTFAPKHQAMALDLLASGRIPGKKLVTHVLPLEQFDAGVRLASEGKALKVAFLL